jgi:glyoxylase-like metal-dependent hydrolase (beta-lactamase superfamily II)
MKVVEIAAGLWTWTGRRESIDADVGCVYLEGEDGIVLIDPLVPPEDEEHFLRALDKDAALAGRRGFHILTTVARHERSAAVLAERYDARIWPARTTPLPNGVVAFDSGLPDEVVFWIPGHRALVTGDVLRGRDGGLAPVGDRAQDAVTRLVELEPERILVSHGESVLDDAAAALRGALSRPAGA